jgi:sporulation related protein
MAGKGTRHRFELSRLEIAGVLVSATAGLFVVFLLGIYAGRGLAERHTDGGEKIVRMAVAPAAEQTPGNEDRLTFYDTLGGDERVAKGEARAAVERPAAAPPVEEAPSAPAPHEHAKPAESAPIAKPMEPAAAPTAKEERAAKGEAIAAASKHEPAMPAAQPTPAAKLEHAPTPPPATARVAVALAPAAMPTPVTRTGAKGDWSVQVSATRDPRTADGVLRRLKAKGYDAFVLKVRRRGETFYRVRVGHYATLEEAQQVVTRLRREPGVPEAFVASD